MKVKFCSGQDFGDPWRETRDVRYRYRCFNMDYSLIPILIRFLLQHTVDCRMLCPCFQDVVKFSWAFGLKYQIGYSCFFDVPSRKNLTNNGSVPFLSIGSTHQKDTWLGRVTSSSFVDGEGPGAPQFHPGPSRTETTTNPHLQLIKSEQGQRTSSQRSVKPLVTMATC